MSQSEPIKTETNKKEITPDPKWFKNDFKDLTGDPVYDYFARETLAGHRLVSGRITHRKSVGPKEARVLIEIRVLDEKTKRLHTYEANYNKKLKLISDPTT